MQTKLIVRELCKEILNLSMAISEETDVDVYVRYYPHVNELDVEIYPKGFEKGYENYASYEIDLTGDNAVGKLREIKDNILRIWRKVKCRKLNF